MISLTEALQDKVWLNHKIGNLYNMKGDKDKWKIAYYPLFGTYKGGQYVEFEEPRALVEKPFIQITEHNGTKIPLQVGTDFREIPLHFLTNTTTI